MTCTSLDFIARACVSNVSSAEPATLRGAAACGVDDTGEEGAGSEGVDCGARAACGCTAYRCDVGGCDGDTPAAAPEPDAPDANAEELDAGAGETEEAAADPGARGDFAVTGASAGSVSP